MGFVTILSQNGWSILEKIAPLPIAQLIKIAINIRIGLIINFAVSVATTRERVIKEKYAAMVIKTSFCNGSSAFSGWTIMEMLCAVSYFNDSCHKHDIEFTVLCSL